MFEAKARIGSLETVQVVVCKFEFRLESTSAHKRWDSIDPQFLVL